MNFRSLFLQLREAITVSQAISALNVALITSAALVGGNFAASIVEHEYLQVPHQEASFVPPQKTVVDKPRRQSEFQEILNQNVFNAEVRKEKVVAPPPAPLVEEKINAGKVLQTIISNLELRAIHYQKGHYIWCVIKNKKKQSEEIFTIGDEVFETGASVKRIYTTYGSQRVLLQMGDEVGVLEYLGTEKKEAPKVAKATPAPKPSRRSSPAQTSKQITSDYSADGKNFHITATEVDSHLNDFGSLLNQARMVPYFQNGKHSGFRVKAIDKGSLYEKLGLQNNDIIKAVNGESLAEAGGEKLMGLFKLLRNEREFTVEIERGGSSQTLNYFVN